MPSPAARRSADFRPDIEGLRGVAVLLVVLFHAGIGPVAGGFVGVDVFFVISGFLITGLLLRERERTGRIDLRAFYARRIRRLAPAALLVLVATIAAAWRLLDPLARGEALVDALASALSVANLRFAAAAGDYFAADGRPSPFLHFWSLAVEEQFYLVWPALLLVAARLVRPRVGIGLVLAVIAGSSFALSIVLTETSPAAAFYLLPTRAWQLAAGGLLAVAAHDLVRLPAGLRRATGWAGLGAVAAAGLLLHGDLPYPGALALAPTLGAVALIAAGPARGGAGALLSLAPLRFTGRISYALYLWHWPLLVLGTLAVGSEPSLAGRLGLVGAAIALATVSTFLVEEPIRRGLRSPLRRAVATATAGLLALAITGTLGAGLSGRIASDGGAARGPGGQAALVPAAPLPTELDAGPTGHPGPTPAASPGDARAAKPAPRATATPAPRPAATPAPRPAATPKPRPAPVVTARPEAAGRPTATFVPALEAIATDDEALKADRCIAYERETEPRDCRYGSGSHTVALVGDSHASHWFPALHAVARQRGWTIVPMVKVSCPFIDLPVRSSFFKREYRECAAFNEAVVERLEALRPDLTIVAINHWVTPQDPDAAKVDVVGAALGRQVARVPGRAVILADSPHSGHDVPACLAANPGDPGACTTPRAKAFSGHAAIEQVGARAAGVPLIDLGPAICADDPCPDVVRGMVVYRDYHHLTATFSRSLAPALERALRRAGVG